MSTGAEGDANPAVGPQGGATASSAEVASFVKRAKELSGQHLISFKGEAEAVGTKGTGFKTSHGMVAAAVALVLGGGFIGGAQFLTSTQAPVAAAAQAGPPPETTAQLVHRLEDQVHTLKVSLDSMRASADNAKQDDAIRGLKRSVDVLKQDLEVAKAGNAGAVSQLSAKIDKLDRDPTPKLAEISSRLDKLDHGDKTPNTKLAEITARLDQLKPDPSAPKLSDITARLDRIEHSISSPATTASIASAAKPAAVPLPPVVVASAEPKSATPPKPPTVDGWLLRDVYGGVALLEGRSGGLREVSPGQFVPGVGEIRSIERRGRAWVVVTSRGIIEADNR